MASENHVSTIIRDDFFNDPFFKDWWGDFDLPLRNVQFNRQLSEGPRRTLLDSFLSLRDGSSSLGHKLHTSSSQSAAMTLRNGKFSIELDIQDFEPEDIDIKVEAGSLILEGRREMRGRVRTFNQRFALPSGIDVSKLSTEVTSEGGLIISAPQMEDESTVALLEGFQISQKGDVDIQASSEAKKTTSEAAFEVEGGHGHTKSVQDSQKKSQQSVTKRETEDGYEEEIFEEFEEFTSSSSSTTMMVTSSGAGAGEINIPMMVVGGAAGGTQTTEMSSTNQNVKAKDGKILEMQKTGSNKTETKEMVIPISIEGRAPVEKQKTPKPRMLPFEFPGMPSLPSSSLTMDCSLPGMGMPAMPGFQMPMSSAADMMAQMQAQVQQQMGQMQMGSMQQAMQMQMESASSMQQTSAQSVQAAQTVQAQQVQQQTQQQTVESAQDMAEADFFVPLRHAAKVKQNALSEASAMAKMRDGVFELVVNIQGFEPEDVQIFSVEQTVFVKAKCVTVDGFVTNSYEQKFNLPEDVDTSKMTSGMSRDGILMIRVPKRASPERIIPIKRDVEIRAVRSAIAKCVQSSVDLSEVTAEQIHTELQEKNIAPLNIEKPEDAVKAASAEVIEALTVGVAETLGAEAGEAAGLKAAAVHAEQAVASVVAQAVLEVATQIGSELAGEAGVKAAIAAATQVGQEAGVKAARDLGAEMGAEIGRVAGHQAASVAAAEELAKMNMAEITEEKAHELKGTFEELGNKVGAEAGDKAGQNAGDNIDPELPIREAVAAAKAAAEKAALKVRGLQDLMGDEAEKAGAKAGEDGGKAAGETEGETVAVKQAVEAAKEAGVGAAIAILGEKGATMGEALSAKVAEEVARKMGKQLGGEAGLAAGRVAGARAAVLVAKEEVAKIDAVTIDEAGVEQLKEKILGLAVIAGKTDGADAGKDAAREIDIGAIVGEAVAAATKAVEEQALEIKAFETMSAEVAKEAGKIAGEASGREAGGVAGVKVALEAVMVQAIEAATACGAEIYGDEGAAVAKVAGESAAKEIAMKLGKELGEAAGVAAGLVAGEEAGDAAGVAEAAKHNVLEMKAEQIDALKVSLAECGKVSGAAAGSKAGEEAGSKIDIPQILQKAIEAAKAAAAQAANMSKASGDEAAAKEVEAMAVECAKEAAGTSGVEAAVEAAIAALEDFLGVDVDKVAEEAGGAKGKEVFAEFGEQIGKEAGLSVGRKVAIAAATKIIMEVASVEGRAVGIAAGEMAALEEIKKQDLKSMTQEKVAALRALFQQVGANSGKEAGAQLCKALFSKINMEAVLAEVRVAAAASAEKYCIKAREFQKLATKIAEEAGGKAGEKHGEQDGGEAGEEAGQEAGEKAGRAAGQKIGEEIAGEEGGKVGGEAGARAGRKFGFKVGREAGIKTGVEVGRLEGRKAGALAGAAEAMKHFKIGISKEKVMALKKVFAEVGNAAGVTAASQHVRVVSAKRGEEEGSKFGLEQGRKAGEAAARKLKDAENKLIKDEGALVGEQAGGVAGEKAGVEEGEKAGGDEAERLGGNEGERIGREIAGEEGAKLGREIGAAAAKLAGAKYGKKIGKTAGAKAGRDAGKKAAIVHAQKISLEVSREKVTAMRKLFAEISSGAGWEAGVQAARAEVMKSIQEVAVRAAAKAAREALLQLASRGKVKLSADWKPTALISVINARSDLSDMEKIKLAAKAKMEGNLGDLLPKRFLASGSMREKDDSLAGKLKFDDDNTTEVTENVDQNKRWKTVVFTDLPDDPSKKESDMSKEKVSSLKKRFETKNMKNNEAYVIM